MQIFQLFLVSKFSQTKLHLPKLPAFIFKIEGLRLDAVFQTGFFIGQQRLKSWNYYLCHFSLGYSRSACLVIASDCNSQPACDSLQLADPFLQLTCSF